MICQFKRTDGQTDKAKLEESVSDLRRPHLRWTKRDAALWCSGCALRAGLVAFLDISVRYTALWCVTV